MMDGRGEGGGVSYSLPLNGQEVLLQPMLFSLASRVSAFVEDTFSSSSSHSSEEMGRGQGA